MRYQFRHEAHNRDDKKRRPDYLQAMRYRDESEGRRELREDTIQSIRTATFVLAGQQYKTAWSLADFSTKNGLATDDPATKKGYDAIALAVTQDIETIVQAIWRAPIRLKKVNRYLSMHIVEWFDELPDSMHTNELILPD